MRQRRFSDRAPWRIQAGGRFRLDKMFAREHYRVHSPRVQGLP